MARKQGRPIPYGQDQEIEEFVDEVLCVCAEITVDYCPTGFKVYYLSQLVDMAWLRARLARHQLETGTF